MEVKNIALDIPNGPIIPLGNYMLDMVGATDGVGDSIYVYDAGEVVRELWKDIISGGRKINVRSVFPKELGLEPTHFYAIMKGKRGIAIQSLNRLHHLWKFYCDKSDDEVKIRWDAIHERGFPLASFSKPEKFFLPKAITPKISYIMGYLVGDGCFDSSKKHYRVKISETNKNQLEYVLKPLLVETLGAEPIIKNEGSGRLNSNFILINSKPIFRFLRNILGIKVGEIPALVKKMDATNKSFFLRGVFDSEGCADASYLGSKIRVFQASKEFLDEVIELFSDIGITTNGPYGPFFKYPSEKFKYQSKWYAIEIRKKSEILKFIDKVGSSHVGKIPKLQFLSGEIRSRYKYPSS